MHYVPLVSYVIFCSAVALVLSVYATPSVAWNGNQLRSLCGIAIMWRPVGRMLFSALHFQMFIVMFILSKGGPMAFLSVGILTAGIGFTSFEMDTHWHMHFVFVTVYVVASSAYATSHAVLNKDMWPYALAMHFGAAMFLISFAWTVSEGVRKWTTANTVWELLWLAAWMTTHLRLVGKLEAELQ